MTDKLRILETIDKDPKSSTFSRFLASSGAGKWLSGDGIFTVFVPTNDAFAKISESRMNQLILETNQTRLKELMAYHILPGRVMAAAIAAEPTRKTVSGQEITFTDSNGLHVNGAGIQARNIEAINGVIHQVDTVLGPPLVTERPMFSPVKPVAGTIY